MAARRKRTFLILLASSIIAAVIWLGVVSPPNTPRIFLNQRRAVESLDQLNAAEREYAITYPDTGFACGLGELAELASQPGSHMASVDRVLASGTKAAYRFEIQCGEPVGRSRITNYKITALPVEPGTTGRYALCTDQSGDIWFSDNGVAADCFAAHKSIEKKYTR